MSVRFVAGRPVFELSRTGSVVGRLEGREIEGGEVEMLNFNLWTGVLRC